MPTPSLSGGRDELSRFRLLAGLTAIASFALIVIGGIVRVSDSGLGCGPAGSGTEGWPLCDGTLVPLVGGSTLVEFSHRVVAGIVAVLIVVLAWRAWRTMRDRPWLVRGSFAALGLVLVQAALGGLTVEHNLHSVLVAIHLGVAMVLLAILLGLYRAAAAEPEPPPAGASGGLRLLATGAAVLVLATIIAGGYVAGTEGEGTASEPVLGAHMACGKEFPGCAGALLPFGRHSLVDAQLTHRVLMFLATIAVLSFVAMAIGRRIRSWPVLTAALIVLLQVLLGAMNVWLGKHAGLIVGHLTLGTLLWATVVWAGLTLVAVPGRVGAAAEVPGAGAQGAVA